MPTKFSQKQILIMAGAVVIVFGLLALIYFNIRPKPAPTGANAVTLNVWGTDSPKVFNDLISSYTTYDASAKVVYTQIDPANYQNTIVEALAAGDGPDVFEIGNRDLPKWQALLTPLPSSTYAQTFNLVKLENYFPSVVESDFVSNQQIYALPLSIDTLAMIYNKDLFDSAGIALPPTTWDDFENDVAKLRQVNAQGQITQAAAAIGGSESSIPNAPDLLSLLMLQNGTQMTKSDLSSATFAQEASGTQSPGLNAFNFYLQFANAASPYYTWSDSLGNAEQNFVQGKVAILFDYQSTLQDIMTKAPFLNVGVAPMPQPDGATISVNYPSYQGLAVSRTGQTIAAWNFILYLTTYAAGESIYSADTGKPPALRYTIAQDETDPNLSVFAAQALTARSWYEVDDTQIGSIFNNAILNVLGGSVDSSDALLQAQESVNQLMSAQQTTQQ